MTHQIPSGFRQELVDGWGYSEHLADHMAKRLVTIDNTIWNAFLVWWETREVPEIEIEGYTVAKLVLEYNQLHLGAFLTLDWLLREPEEAKKALAYGVM